MEKSEFICPVRFLGYIFNADLDGLADDEINRIEDVLSGYCCFSASEDVFFSYKNDFNNLGDDCVTLTALYSGLLPCHHNYIQKDTYWKSCTHCGMIAPLGQ